MGTTTYLPKRLKAGAEAKMLNDAGVKVKEENMKPTKLNYEGNEINRTHYVSLRIKHSDVQMWTGIRNEEEWLAHALMLCNCDLDVLSSSN